jgi:hypothetical protein
LGSRRQEFENQRERERQAAADAALYRSLRCGPVRAFRPFPQGCLKRRVLVCGPCDRGSSFSGVRAPTMTAAEARNEGLGAYLGYYTGWSEPFVLMLRGTQPRMLGGSPQTTFVYHQTSRPPWLAAAKRRERLLYQTVSLHRRRPVRGRLHRRLGDSSTSVARHAASRPECLAKDRRDNGVVIFRDSCSNEWAMNVTTQQAAPLTEPTQPSCTILSPFTHH